MEIFLMVIIVIVILVIIAVGWFFISEFFLPVKDNTLYFIGAGSDDMSSGRWVPPEELDRRKKAIEEMYPDQEER